MTGDTDRKIVMTLKQYAVAMDNAEGQILAMAVAEIERLAARADLWEKIATEMLDENSRHRAAMFAEEREPIERIPASINFADLPPGLAGKWVAVQKDQTLLGFGDSIGEALAVAGFGQGEPVEGVVVARVPEGCG